MASKKKIHSDKSAKIKSDGFSVQHYDDNLTTDDEEEYEEKRKNKPKRELKNYTAYTPEVYQDYEMDYYFKNLKRDRKKSSK